MGKINIRATYFRLQQVLPVGDPELPSLPHCDQCENGHAEYFKLGCRWDLNFTDPSDRKVCGCQPATQELPSWTTWASCYWESSSVAYSKSLYTVREAPEFEYSLYLVSFD
jgi:hypothetical protein